MAVNSKDYKEGYSAAIEAIKQALEGNADKSDMNTQGQGSDDGRDMDLSGTPAGDAMNSNGQGQPNGESNSASGGQGVVTAADCAGQYGDNVPKTAGGMMSTEDGNKLAKAEGYEEGPSGDAVANQWKDVAIKAAQKMIGKDPGGFASKILSIWKTSTDWKKSFRKIIGRSLNTQDKRSAFANKNILATQNRVARTDKDKFDAIDYMCIFTDSSGSISDDDLKYMLSEIYAIALALKPETLVVGQFDTKIQDIKYFHTPQEFKKYTTQATVKGRGGTDCKCIWNILKEDQRFKRSQAELVIIITDGYLDTYKRDPKSMSNLCWCILDNPAWDDAKKEAHTSTIHLNSKDIHK